MSILSSVALGWFTRRILDVGGWLGMVITGAIGVYSALPPQTQAAVTQAIQGHWGDITLSSLTPLLVYLGSQVVSFRATVKPQVVTKAGTKVSMKELPPSAQVVVAEKAETAAAKRPTLAETLADLFKPRTR